MRTLVRRQQPPRRQRSRRSRAAKRLPPSLASRLGDSLGFDFSAVRISEDHHADALGALSLTRGLDVHFAPGKYAPETPRGLRILAHELVHVVQQARGRVRTPRADDVGTPDGDPALEREADVLGAAAAAGLPARVPEGPPGLSPTGPAPVQLLKPDAEQYNKTHGLGLAVSHQSVSAYVNDVKVPLHHRQGLHAAWNQGQNATWSIPGPTWAPPAPSSTGPPSGGLVAKRHKQSLTLTTDPQREKEVRAALLKNANLSDSESEPDTDDELEDFAESASALLRLGKDAAPAVTTKWGKTADTVQTELGKGGLSLSTFQDVNSAQDYNPRLRLSSNKIARAAHRQAIARMPKKKLVKKHKAVRPDGTIDPTKLGILEGGKPLGPQLYELYRKDFGGELPRAMQTLGKKYTSGKYKKTKKQVDVAKVVGDPTWKAQSTAKRASFPSSDGRSFALEHNVNKALHPTGALSPYNLTLSNDDRSNPQHHVYQHRIKGGRGSSTTDYSAMPPSVALAFLAAIEAPSLRAKRKKPGGKPSAKKAPAKKAPAKGPPKKKRKIDRL